jgi:hypothetical protein
VFIDNAPYRPRLFEQLLTATLFLFVSRLLKAGVHIAFFAPNRNSIAPYGVTRSVRLYVQLVR